VKKKRHKAEEIIAKLREIEKMQAGGKTIEEACKDLGIADQTYYRRRKLYGKMPVDELKRLKELEKENARLKRIVADQALDLAMLKEIAEGKWQVRRASVKRSGICESDLKSPNVAPVGWSVSCVRPSGSDASRIRKANGFVVGR
jgi:transposase-like protein